MRQDMGDAWGGRLTGGSRNVVVEDLHRETAGNRGSVGGATSFIWGVCEGNWIRRGGGGGRREAWWLQEASQKKLWAALVISREDKRKSSGGENVTQ